MFKKSFGNVLKRKAKLPYVTSIDFHALKTKEKVIEGIPVVCTQCGGILTKASLVKTSPELGRHWNCEFCGTLNVIEGDFVIPEGDDVEWIIEKKPEDDIEVGTKIGVGTKEHIVAVIDVSGSMSDGKLEAVKHSLIQSLKDLKMNSPYSRFALIAFSTEVFLFNSNGEKVLVLEGDVLHSIKGIEKAFETKLDFAPISDTAEKWIHTVSQLRPLNYTALGPAFLGGITLLGRISGGGRLILLTDGLANEGLGNLESSATGKKFYQECAAKCMEKSVTVEVIGVAPEDDSSRLALDVLGRLADSTGGEIFYITASEVQKAFEELRKREYLARDVNIRVVTDATFKLKSVTGAGVPAVPAPKEPVRMGAVTEDREVFFELETAEEEVKKEEVPMQAQVTYIDSEGNKRLRVLTSRAAVVEEEVEFNKAYDARVVTTNVVQAAGESYYSGKADDAKKRLNMLKETLAKEDGIQFQEEALNVLDIQEREIDEEEAEIADKAAAPSARAAKGLKRKRTSEEDLF